MFCSSLIKYRAEIKVWILIFAVLSLVVSSQACPPGHFSGVIVASIDQTVENPRLYIEDPKLYFFKEVLHFQEEEIHHVFEDAISFFNYTFGLDFSHSPPDEGYHRYLENAKMFPAILRNDINYIATANNWIRNGNTRSRCYRIHTGSVTVTLLNYTTLHGRYGGDEGKPAGPSEPLVYGFYSIDACEQSPVLIHYRCPIPIRAEPIDRTQIAQCYTFNRALGRGRTHGISMARPDQDDPRKYRINLKSIISFSSSGERDGPERDGPERDGTERDDTRQRE